MTEYSKHENAKNCPALAEALLKTNRDGDRELFKKNRENAPTYLEGPVFAARAHLERQFFEVRWGDDDSFIFSEEGRQWLAPLTRSDNSYIHNRIDGLLGRVIGTLKEEMVSAKDLAEAESKSIVVPVNLFKPEKVDDIQCEILKLINVIAPEVFKRISTLSVIEGGIEISYS